MKLKGPFLIVCLLASMATAAEPSRKLALRDNFPKPIHYRYANNFSMKQGEEAAYEWWMANYGGSMGVELDNRIPFAKEGQDRVIRRVMEEHPEKFFIYYTTGHIKVPETQPRYFDPATGPIADYYPGHWAYQPRTRVLQDSIPLEPGPTTIRVEMAGPTLGNRESTTDEDMAGTAARRAFATYKDCGDDLCIYTLRADGTPDWVHSEQATIVALDEQAGTITVKRGCYGSTPRAFRGQIYAAVHCQVVKFQGWYYNFSTFCPMDSQGRQAGDIWAAKYAALFQPGGRCIGFDAIQQDTQVEEVWPVRGVDLNNNGTDDALEDLGGINWFSVGLTQTLKKLREQLPPDVNMMPDAGNRAFHYVNGWEVEGFPGRHDPSWRSYSEVCNRLDYSRHTCLPPRFTHVQHKIFNYTLGSDEKAEILSGKKLPAHLSRVVLALATVHEAGVTWYSLPPKDPDGTSGVYDELRMGEARRLGWLGRPVGNIIYPAMQTPNLAEGRLSPPSGLTVSRGTLARVENGELVLSNPDLARSSAIALQLISRWPDLSVFVRLRGRRREGVEVKTPRYVHVSLSGGTSYDGYSIPRTPDAVTLGMILKDGRVKMLGTPVEAKIEFVANLHTLRVWHKDPNMAKLFWEVRRKTPADARLYYWVHRVNAPYSIEAAEVSPGGLVSQFREISRVKRVQGPTPLQRSVDLVPLGLTGKEVVFRFLSESRANSAASNQGAWSEVGVARPDAGGNVPAGPSQWSLEGFFGEEAQPQVFHFPHTPVDTPLELRLEFEGGEEVTVEWLTVHAAPAVMLREFEHGLVLANPSPRPFTFDLRSLGANKHYKRFRATPTQDPETNSGQPVGRSVAIAPLDGLFLVRQ